MTLSIKNGRYPFLTRVNLMSSMSLWRVWIITNFKLPIYQTFKIKLILY